MTVRHIDQAANRPQRDALFTELLQEWRHGGTSAEPIIVTEGGTENSPRHVYVVWGAWSELDQRQRSEIIMDAAEQLYGRDKALGITVAMGLTMDEAHRMKMAKALGI